MLYSKVLISFLILPVLFATSSSEATVRCQKIYEIAQKDITAIKEQELVKVGNEALSLIQEIISSFSAATDPKTLPNQIKRCVALGDFIKVIKEELTKKSQTNTKKNDAIRETATSNENESELTEEKPKKKPKKEKQIDPEKGALNLSNTLKEIAESEINKSKITKPTL